MKRHVLIYGLIGGTLITILQWTQYRFLVLEHSIEIYAGLIALTFAVLGIWLGLRITSPPQNTTAPKLPATSEANAVALGVVPPHKIRDDRGITPRELEILNLIAHGLSNREIAATLFVSENTVKTHSSRVFDKLGARRRTQAVQLGKQFGLLP